MHSSVRIWREGPLFAPRVLTLSLSSPQYELKSVSLLTGSNHRFGHLVRNVRCDTVVQSCGLQNRSQAGTRRRNIRDAASQGLMRLERHTIPRDDAAKTAPAGPSWWPVGREHRGPAPCAGAHHCSGRCQFLTQIKTRYSQSLARIRFLTNGYT